MTHLIHQLAGYPDFFGLLAQGAVLGTALKRKNKAGIARSLLLIVALGLLAAATLFTPNPPPNLLPDLLSIGGAVFLLTPGVEALLKLKSGKDD